MVFHKYNLFDVPSLRNIKQVPCLATREPSGKICGSTLDSWTLNSSTFFCCGLSYPLFPLVTNQESLFYLRLTTSSRRQRIMPCGPARWDVVAGLVEASRRSLDPRLSFN